MVTLVILGKLYVANAGDSRAIICDGENIEAMSVDFTPERERERIRKLAKEQPDLLGKCVYSYTMPCICGLKLDPVVG